MPVKRWCPTPEQLMILEEIYKGGVGTPKASHIHKITAHLSEFGKIEGNNVFYWFQNRKARDRQKLKQRQLFLAKLQQQQQQQPHNDRRNLTLNFYYSSLPFLLDQGTGGSVEDASSVQLKPYTLKTDPQADRCKSTNRMYGHDNDWMIVEMGPTNSGPLKTLELFPTSIMSMHKP